MPHSSRYEIVLKSLTDNSDHLSVAYTLNVITIIEISEESELSEEWHELRIVTNQPEKVAEFAMLHQLKVKRITKLV